ncbi:heavy metal translocating P-type ATPase [Halovivax ruber XH-70]|uniref:Heavy metal translocating P-type ATPase n=1 Tax=Halovivax ruber (strain DSM 18193 / JCM 13892 / XH-70) TaxID=797302 RepID=L0I6V9_HALRX|nr:heavy metal translocating P-type ATPase [Halovivax ruber]AGB15270.1 heavy metal translocating P-type ATPase [Halovivax ruber XH-70]
MNSGDAGPSRRCSFCGTALTDDSTDDSHGPTQHHTDEGVAEESFCSPGCRRLADALDPAPAEHAGTDSGQPAAGSGPDAGPVSEATPDNAAASSGEPAGDLVRTHFRMDGMHAAHDERYLESVATGIDGVDDASASYVTESVSVDHDPAQVSAETLAERLTGLGFTAFRRDRQGDQPERNDRYERNDRHEAADTGAGSEGGSIGADVTGRTHRDREVSGFRKRRADDFLEMRYVVGVVFGSFLLVPYAVLFYPAALADLTGWAALSIFGGSMELDWGVLPLFLGLTGAILYLTGRPLLRGAFLALSLRRANAHLLATLPIVAAYLYGAIAVLTGRFDLYFDLTIVVAATVMGAIYWESTVKRDAVSRLTALTRASVAEARRLTPDGSSQVVPTGDLSAGDRILVRQGERIPVDGTLADGSCTVAEALLTGESLPQERTAGDEVVGGSTVTTGSAVVTVGDRSTSRLDGLTRRVWNLQSATHAASDRTDDLAGRLLPLVVGAALLAAAGTLLVGDGPIAALRHLLLALLVGSPWALAFATPVSVATSLQEAARKGVVVFDETVFGRLRDVDTVVFDKTGTLTTGEMTVRDATGPDRVLRAAAALERRAAHPAADAIVEAFLPDAASGSGGGAGTDGAGDHLVPQADGATDESVPTDGAVAGGVPTVDAFETAPTGVAGEVDGEPTLVGHPSLFAVRGWSIDEAIETRVEAIREAGHLPVVVGQHGRAEGVVAVGDQPRDAWTGTVESLADRDVDVVVLTGDDAAGADFLTGRDGITAIYADVPPTGKVEAVRRLAAEGRVAMVGDGTNDAPALAAADLGIALGGGTALAADAAALAIADDDLAGVERAFALAARARRRRRGTRWLAFSYNAIAIPAVLVGLASPLVTMAGAVVATGSILAYATYPIRFGRD